MDNTFRYGKRYFGDDIPIGRVIREGTDDWNKRVPDESCPEDREEKPRRFGLLQDCSSDYSDWGPTPEEVEEWNDSKEYRVKSARTSEKKLWGRRELREYLTEMRDNLTEESPYPDLTILSETGEDITDETFRWLLTTKICPICNKREIKDPEDFPVGEQYCCHDCYLEAYKGGSFQKGKRVGGTVTDKILDKFFAP